MLLQNYYKSMYFETVVYHRWQVDDVRVRATGKAVPLPKPGDITGEPGPLPAPARVTSAYFEVRQILLHSSFQFAS